MLKVSNSILCFFLFKQNISSWWGVVVSIEISFYIDFSPLWHLFNKRKTFYIYDAMENHSRPIKRNCDEVKKGSAIFVHLWHFSLGKKSVINLYVEFLNELRLKLKKGFPRYFWIPKCPSFFPHFWEFVSWSILYVYRILKFFLFSSLVHLSFM